MLDLREPGVGAERFDLFKGGLYGTCWYYGAMANFLLEALPGSRLTTALQRSAIELHEAAGVRYPAPEPEAV